MKYPKAIVAIILFILAALAGTAQAADTWKTSWAGGAYEYYSDQKDMRLYVACPTEDTSPDRFSSIILMRNSTGNQISKFQIIANGNTYDGPITTVSTVGSKNFRSLMEDMRKGGATVKYAMGTETVLYPKANAAKFFPAPGRKFPCQTNF